MVSAFAGSALGRQPDDMGWSRKGRKGAFRYYDSSGKRIADESKLARIEALAIPPAWKEVSISPRSTAKLQATGFDAAGRKQYLYSADYRAQQERAKYDMLIRFGDALPALREAMALHFEQEEFDRERVSAIALRLIELGWLRVGSERYVRDGTYGVTTLLRRHVEVRGKRVCLSFPAKHGIRVRTQVVDPDLAAAMRRMLEIKGPRVFKYEWEGRIYNLTNKQLNEYVKVYLGEEFSAKDFRTWGGTLLAAIYLAERAAKEGFPDSEQEQKRSVSAVMRRVAERLGNTPAVTRESYVSPAVVEQYLDGRTIDDFRPRHLRVVKARDVGLSPEEQAMLSLLRSWRIRRAREAA
jgi:DNA topoisomerase-1